MGHAKRSPGFGFQVPRQQCALVVPMSAILVTQLGIIAGDMKLASWTLIRNDHVQRLGVLGACHEMDRLQEEPARLSGQWPKRIVSNFGQGLFCVPLLTLARLQIARTRSDRDRQLGSWLCIWILEPDLKRVIGFF